MVDRRAELRGRVAALVPLACRLGVGGVFLYASLAKIADPGGFAQAIAHYRLAPALLLHPLALLLPWLEAVTGAALLAGVARRGAALLAIMLALLFAGAVASALARGLDISCGCFDTTGGEKVGLDLLLRNLALLAACLPILKLHARDRWALGTWRSILRRNAAVAA